MEIINDIANELISKFHGLTLGKKSETIGNKGLINAKKCAIITCNEIIAQYIDEKCETVKCYKEVKKEIRKI